MGGNKYDDKAEAGHEGAAEAPKDVPAQPEPAPETPAEPAEAPKAD